MPKVTEYRRGEAQLMAHEQVMADLQEQIRTRIGDADRLA
jgi:hypothetical protein